jgi:DNA transformation protein and related proteins
VTRDDGFIDYLHELLGPLGTLTARRMFGGHGLYLDGLFIAIVADGRLFLKADAETVPAFIAADCAPFSIVHKGRPLEMSYWSVPDSAMDTSEDMAPWAKLAVAAALRKPAVKKPAKSAKKKAAPKAPRA